MSERIQAAHVRHLASLLITAASNVAVYVSLTNVGFEVWLCRFGFDGVGRKRAWLWRLVSPKGYVGPGRLWKGLRS